MIQTLKDVEFGIRAKIHSWSTIRRILEIRKFAQFTQKPDIRALLKANSVDPWT